MDKLHATNIPGNFRSDQEIEEEFWTEHSGIKSENHAPAAKKNKAFPLIPDHFDFLREDQSRFYDSLPLGYLCLDEKGFIKSANSTAVEMLGVEKNNFINTGFINYIFKEDRKKFKFDKNNLSHLSSQSFDIRLKKGQSSFWVNVNIFFEEVFFFLINR
ncbi:MAG: PAS domain-containing protein [Desulfobacteraceae bacterium]|nr:PAS domain-containing protein [Desulfobacteraceae bacterium]